jgi:hypothetical protein
VDLPDCRGSCTSHGRAACQLSSEPRTLQSFQTLDLHRDMKTYIDDTSRTSGSHGGISAIHRFRFVNCCTRRSISCDDIALILLR